jgi:ribosomal protein L44E
MKQKKRPTMKEKQRKFKTIKAWLGAKEKKQQQKEAEELGKIVVDCECLISKKCFI